MRLIDSDSLKTKVEAMVEHRMIESDYDFGRNQAFDYVADILIDDAPTIDAVEVVRCKDCKHRQTDECPMFFEEQIDITEYIIHDYTRDDGYCSWGERREDGEE